MKSQLLKHWRVILIIIATIFLAILFIVANNNNDEVQCEIITTPVVEIESTTELETILSAEIETSEQVTVSTSQLILCEWLGYELSEYEYELLCRTTFCEAGNQDLETQRAISDFYFETNGIYKRACEYLAFLFRQIRCRRIS